MTRWIVWALILATTSGTGTLASRARNTQSYGYHGVAALLSHGTFFIGQIIGIDLIVEIIHTRSSRLALAGFACYAVASTAGSIAAQFVALRYLETNHDRRVGGYRER